jgi:hypothetical protein
MLEELRLDYVHEYKCCHQFLGIEIAQSKVVVEIWDWFLAQIQNPNVSSRKLVNFCQKYLVVCVTGIIGVCLLC